MRQITIVRGLPGSGKSTLARKLAAESGAFLLDLDSLMVTGGEYRWSPGAFRTAFAESLGMVAACARRNCDCIYCESLPHKSQLVDILAAYGPPDRYECRVLSIAFGPYDSYARNVHAVPLGDILRMRDEWEAWPGEEVLAAWRPEAPSEAGGGISPEAGAAAGSGASKAPAEPPQTQHTRENPAAPIAGGL